MILRAARRALFFVMQYLHFANPLLLLYGDCCGSGGGGESAMMQQPRLAPNRGLRATDWILILGLQFGTLVLAVILGLLASGIDDFLIVGHFRDRQGLAWDEDQNRFEPTDLVRCINDLCDVANVTEKNENLCLVVTWTNQGPDGFLVVPRPCSTGVELGDFADVTEAGPGQCVCTPNGEDFEAAGPFQLLAQKNQPNGYCPLNLAALVPNANLPPELMRIQGCWNAMMNIPILVSGGCPEGDFYVVNIAGGTMLDGTNDWNVGDALVCVGGNFWKRIRSEMELNDLTDVNTMGQMNGEVLKFLGGTWQPEPECCADQFNRVGFFARVLDFGIAGGPFWQIINTWTLPAASVYGDATWNNAGFNQGFDTSTGIWTPSQPGWYHMHVKLRFRGEGGGFNTALRIINLANPGGAFTQGTIQGDDLTGLGNFANTHDTSMILAFCPTDEIAVQVIVSPDDGDIITNSDMGFNFWSASLLPVARMPVVSCPMRRRTDARQSSSSSSYGEEMLALMHESRERACNETILCLETRKPGLV